MLFVCLPATAMQRVGIAFGGVCPSRKLLHRNRCNLVGTCAVVNARSGRKLVTFDLGV